MMLKKYNKNNYVVIDSKNKIITLKNNNNNIAEVKNGFLCLFCGWSGSQTKLKFLFTFLKDYLNEITEKQKHYILITINSKNKKSFLKRLINLKYIMEV